MHLKKLLQRNCQIQSMLFVYDILGQSCQLGFLFFLDGKYDKFKIEFYKLYNLECVSDFEW